MPDAEGRIRVAILAYPEVTISALYTMYDLFAAAGRDWAFITTGVPGEQRMSPYIVSALKGELSTANGPPLGGADIRGRSGAGYRVRARLSSRRPTTLAPVVLRG